MSTLSEPTRWCICHEREISSFYKRAEGYNLLKCDTCSLVYLEEYPSNLFDFLKEVQETDSLEFWSMPEFYDRHRPVFESFFQERFKRLGRYSDFKNGILDVGSGYGFWLNFLSQKGTPCRGVEVEAEACDYAKKEFSLLLENKSFEEADFDETFSCIIMVDVLEHFEQPDKALEKSHELLERDGILFVQVPNVLGFKVPRNHGYGLPYHLWQFDYSSLKKLLESKGFEVCDSWTGVQGVIGAIERGDHGPLKRLYWKIGKLLNCGNRLHVVAKKKSSRDLN